MAGQQQGEGGKKKGCAKKGANARRCGKYRDGRRFEVNKLKRIIQSNGGNAAVAWLQNREKQDKNLLSTSVWRQVKLEKPAGFARAREKSATFRGATSHVR